MGREDKKESYTSSGKHKAAKINTLKRRTQMKINRWKKYQDEITNGKRSGSAKRWDTTGLEKYLQILQNLPTS